MLLDWLLAGDVAIQYQTYRDLQGKEKSQLQRRIAGEGWGAQLLSARKPNGHWGKGYYQPKWISTHYTLLDLKNLSVSPRIPEIREILKLVLQKEKSADGGIYPIGPKRRSDVCVSGMFLNFASYFGAPEKDLESVVDFLLAERMPDGGFNCRSNGSGAVHSSLHSTLSVLEGLYEFEKQGYSYRLRELKKARAQAHEFLLAHKLFRSHRTGKIIHPDFLKFHFPNRWHYDILRALDYMQMAAVAYDPRMGDAIALLENKRTPEGSWKLAAPYSGLTHLQMERSGKPSRWITLKALRVLQKYGSK